jgi:lipooligosaccharide transport system ATP-binding protein
MSCATSAAMPMRKLIAGLEVTFNDPATAQRLTLPQDALAIKAQLGVVSQFDTLDPDFSCAENLRV